MRCTISEPSNPLVCHRELATINVSRTKEPSKLDSPAQPSDAKIFSAHAHRFLRSHNDINQSVVGTEPKQDPASKEQNYSIRLGTDECSFNNIQIERTRYFNDISTFELPKRFIELPSPTARYGLNRSTSRHRNNNHLRIHGYKEEGTTEKPLRMCVLNNIGSIQLDVVRRVRRLRNMMETAEESFSEAISRFELYVSEPGAMRMPVAGNWK